MQSVVAIGECMIEFSRPLPQGKVWRCGYGGDTSNVATYLARMGEDVAYLTAIGRDSFSADMRAEWEEAGIDTSLVLISGDRRPGLYVIETDSAGERSFHYWRGESAARDLFRCPGIEAALQRAAATRLLYLSGITLSLFSKPERERLVDLCRTVRARGGDVAFDSNYRPNGWSSVEEARSAISQILRHVSIGLPTFEDERLLFGDRTLADCLRRWRAAGVSELVIKRGAEGASVLVGESFIDVPTVESPSPRDTTGAGDSFNAAYLSHRLHGGDEVAAAEQGNRLASAVVNQPGAIIPRATMPVMRRSAGA